MKKSKWLLGIFAASLIAQSMTTFHSVSAETTKDFAAVVSSKPGDFHESLLVDGLKRTYYLHVPGSYSGDNAVPLVLNLHGSGSNGDQQSRLTKMNVSADQNGFIVVYPDALENHWNDGRPSSTSKYDDVAFLRQLIKTLSARFHIEQKRIYAAGFSNGAFMCERLALELPDTFAACAMVSAEMTKDNLTRPSGHPIPVLFILGTKDPIVPFQGGRIRSRIGSVVMSAPETIDFWVNYNKCNPTPVETLLSGKKATDMCAVTKKEYSSPGGQGDVIFYQVSGGGHTWPGGPQYFPAFIIGVACQTIKASDEIWKFFAAHVNQ